MEKRAKIIILGIVLISCLAFFNVSSVQALLDPNTGEEVIYESDYDETNGPVLLNSESSSSSSGSGWALSNISSYGLPGATISAIIINVVSWLLTIFWVISVGAFIVSGIMYLASTGNEEVIAKAKKYMLYSIIGVIVGLSGYVLIQAVSLMLQASSPF